MASPINLNDEKQRNQAIQIVKNHIGLDSLKNSDLVDKIVIDFLETLATFSNLKNKGDLKSYVDLLTSSHGKNKNMDLPQQLDLDNLRAPLKTHKNI